MAKGVVGLILSGALLCASCGTSRTPALKEGVSVLGSDMRIGLTADDRAGGVVQIKGTGFQRLAGNTYVFSSADETGSGRLEAGESALAMGAPKSIWILLGQVVAKPSAAGTGSDAQVAELAVSDLKVEGNVPETRLVVETELRAELGMNAVATCRVEAELNYDGTLMGKVEATYFLYGAEGGKMVEIYRGRRGATGSKRVAVVGAGEARVVTAPSFYFDLGPGPHELMFSMNARSSSAPVASPGSGGASGTASLRAEARLRVE